MESGREGGGVEEEELEDRRESERRTLTGVRKAKVGAEEGRGEDGMSGGGRAANSKAAGRVLMEDEGDGGFLAASVEEETSSVARGGAGRGVRRGGSSSRSMSRA